MKKKTNPRKIPRTEEDVQKAFKLGQSQAIEFAFAISCLSVYDIFSPSEEDMNRFFTKHQQNVQAILDGTIKFQDVVAALKDEYGLDITFKK